MGVFCYKQKIFIVLPPPWALNEEETALGDGGETDGLVNILVCGKAQGIAQYTPMETKNLQMLKSLV